MLPFSITASCDCIAPFGCPVVPEVYAIVDKSPGDTVGSFSIERFLAKIDPNESIPSLFSPKEMMFLIWVCFLMSLRA